MWLLWTMGCTCGAPKSETTTLEFTAHSLREVTTRFDDQQVAPLDAQRAFQVAARCPTLTRAELVPSGTGYARLRLEGTRLESVVRAAGALPDGRLVDLSSTAVNGGLELPILAEDVEVWLGLVDDGLFVACRGPGYSLNVKDLRLVP
jgi:hypothetical protein